MNLTNNNVLKPVSDIEIFSVKLIIKKKPVISGNRNITLSSILEFEIKCKKLLLQTLPNFEGFWLKCVKLAFTVFV